MSGGKRGHRFATPTRALREVEAAVARSYHSGVAKLLYSPGMSVDVEDRLLAHVRIVMMTKLRRGESLVLHVPASGGGTNSLWISPSMALALQFYGSRAPELDRELIDDMMRAASGAEGLTITNRV